MDQILDISCTPRSFEFVCFTNITNNDHHNDGSFVMCGSFGLKWLFVLLSHSISLICLDSFLFLQWLEKFEDVKRQTKKLHCLINVCVSPRNGECLCMLVSCEGRIVFLYGVFYCNTAVGPCKEKKKS